MMSNLPAKPPVPTAETQRFFDATARGEIELARCNACGLIPFYPRSVCPDCQSTDFTWQVLSGKGTVYSFSVTRAGVGRSWKEHLPFVVAYVELEEGPILMTNIVGCDVDEVSVGMNVAAVFDDTGEGTSLIRFEPVS